jgi:arsenite-transporting ATPase
MCNKRSGNIFFLGKGGTGKTTIAALTALACANKDQNVALFSMDPAHNLFDVFQIENSSDAFLLRKNLLLAEIKIEFWLKEYLKSIEEKIADSYQHLTALSLEKHIETIRYSPGLEEYAIQYAFEALLAKYEDYTIKIFDMPPTALALRFFNLTKITKIWLEQLIELRKEIVKKKISIDEVRKRHSDQSHDKILKELLRLNLRNNELLETFQDEATTGIFIVQNEDNLSMNEANDIYTKMTENEFKVQGILVNKYQNIKSQTLFTKNQVDIPIYFFPLSNHQLIGQDFLENYLNENLQPEYFNSILES